MKRIEKGRAEQLEDAATSMARGNVVEKLWKELETVIILGA